MAVQAMELFRAQDAATKAALRKGTVDGFDNFVTRVGLQNNNMLSAGTYEFDLITRNRIKLEAAYRGSWIVGAVVDSVAEDMTRAGVDITTNEADADIKDLQNAISRLQIWQSIQNLIKWGRLYGGAVGVIQIKGQKLDTPLDLDTVGQDQFQGIVIYDRWQLNPVLQGVIDSGPEMGLPGYYDIVNNPTNLEPDAPTATGQLRVHHSRCIRYTGIDLPYFQAITEMMWGESILERLWDRLIAFDSVTMSTANLIERANNRTVGIEGLREIIAAGGEAQKGLEAQFAMMREFQANEGLTLLDKNDTFDAKVYTFGGLSDVALMLGQQLSGASTIPLVRLFGQSPAGLSATGDSDIRIYYDGINAQQESKLRNPFEVLLKVLWRSTFNKPAPKDLEFTFTPLWQMSATDKATVAKSNAETIMGAFEGGLTTRETSLKELRQTSGDTGLFSNISDEDIADAEAEADEPPMPDQPELGAAPEESKEQLNERAPDPEKEPVKNLDKAFWKRAWDAVFKESEHPRKSDGEFGAGGGGSSEKTEGNVVHEKDKDAAINFLAGKIKDKDWDKFTDEFDAAVEAARIGEISSKEAAKIKRSHNYTFETSPDNEELHGKSRTNRGKDLKDPSFVLEFGGEYYALDGQHRLNRAIKDNVPANVAIVKGDFLKKFGISESVFEGKKAWE